MEYERLTGSEKAGVLVLSLPEDTVREFLGRLQDVEVERIFSAISRFDAVPPDVQRQVLDEFRESLGRRELAIHGGTERAREIAQRLLDSSRSDRVLERLGREEKRIEWTLRAYSAAFIAETVAEEHPQTIALVLSQLSAERGGAVIAQLPERIRADVVLHLAELESVTTDVMAELEEGVATLFGHPECSETRVGGTDAAARLLNRVAKSQGAAILEDLARRDPEVSVRIRQGMLTFEDLVSIDSRGFQALMREVPTEELVIALKTASEAMKEKIFASVSKRAGEQIREEIELLGPSRLADVEKAQRGIVDLARRLEEDGRISIQLGGSGDVLV